MVSEKPPRRSKLDKEPVTIDLKPEEVLSETDVIAEPVRSIDSDEIETVDTSTSPNGENSAEPSAEQSNDPAPVEEPNTAASAVDEDVDATTDHQPSPAYDEPPAPQHSVSPAEPARQKDRSPAAGLIAAGIFGGIVALLLAGSMQYAGYLPSAENAPKTDTSGLSDEIAALRQEVQTLNSQAGSSELAGRVTALENRPAAGNADTGLTDKLAAVESQLADLKASISANRTDISNRLSEAEAKINDRGPEEQAARAVAAAALKAAIARGGSFEPELTAYAQVGGGDQTAERLKPYAAAGVPSRTQLQTEFSRVADAMLEATAAPDPRQNLASRLFSSALSVVKVRRVGDVEGDTPDAIVARIEDKLRNGDLQASAREWETLPQEAKAASMDFKKKLDARVDVENLVGGTLSRALAGTQG